MAQLTQALSDRCPTRMTLAKCSLSCLYTKLESERIGCKPDLGSLTLLNWCAVVYGTQQHLLMWPPNMVRTPFMNKLSSLACPRWHSSTLWACVAGNGSFASFTIYEGLHQKHGLRRLWYTAMLDECAQIWFPRSESNHYFEVDKNHDSWENIYTQICASNLEQIFAAEMPSVNFYVWRRFLAWCRRKADSSMATLIVLISWRVIIWRAQRCNMCTLRKLYLIDSRLSQA